MVDIVRLVYRPMPLIEDHRHYATASFRATAADTIQLLMGEAHALNWRSPEVVIHLGITEADIRVDGGLYATAKPRWPAAAVILRGPDDKPLRVRCVRFDQWHHNVRAIALSLEKMRAIKRYGVGLDDEVYVGFRELPPPTPA